MEVEFLSAKNGEKTVKINNLFLHSAYNPTAEAERFVSSLSLAYIPEKIVVIEPGFGYCYSFLKKKFPGSKIGSLKLTNEIKELNSFDFKIDYLNNKNNFEDYLFSIFNPQDFFKTLFVSWPSSARIFNNENITVWNVIKSCMEKARTILITDEYFEKKWLKNSLQKIKILNKTVVLRKKINCPVIICASGPSLKSNLKNIKKYQNKFFIICLSSAFSVLKKENIQPDLILSTDGGFWAGQHLKQLKNSVLALPFEAFCPKNILQNNFIIPLQYKDGLSATIINSLNQDFLYCERNGTVSGTAVDFALTYSESKIYFFGLDLCEQKGFQHTQPNELENNSSFLDFRTRTKETRLYPSSLKNQSLEIYKNWFKNQNFPENRIFRIINKETKKNSLGKIKDISDLDFFNTASNYEALNDEKKAFFTEPESFKISKKKYSEVIDILEKNISSEAFREELFPLSYILLSHLQPETEEYKNQKLKIDTELNKLIKELKK